METGVFVGGMIGLFIALGISGAISGGRVVGGGADGYIVEGADSSCGTVILTIVLVVVFTGIGAGIGYITTQ